MATTTFSMRMDADVKSALEAEAKRLDRSIAYVANEAISEFLDKRAYKRECIEAAALEADKGIFISEEAMMDWLDRLETDPDATPPEPDIFPDQKS